MSIPSSTRARRALGGVVLAATIAVIAPSQAAAIDGWERRIQAGPINKDPFKGAVASCPPGKMVIGGGGAIHDGDRRTTRLVGLVPTNGTFAAIAETADLSRTYDWHVTAYAICADAGVLVERGREIVQGNADVGADPLPGPIGNPFRHTSARCPAGKVAYGSGGQVTASGHGTSSSTGGKIGLQMVRTSGVQDIARASARERAEGSRDAWRVTSLAICAKPPEVMEVRYNGEPGDEAKVQCRAGWRMVGPGGGGGTIDGGPSWLRQVLPQGSTPSAIVRLTAPLFPAVGGMVAQGVCAL